MGCTKGSLGWIAQQYSQVDDSIKIAIGSVSRYETDSSWSNQPLLLRRFHSMGNKTSNPLESLSTGKTQAPLCQVRCKQSSSPKTCRAMNHDMAACLCVDNRVLNCLFKLRYRRISYGDSSWLRCDGV